MTSVLLLLIVILYLVIHDKYNKRIIKNYISFITLLLILISGLRHEAVGNDTYAYLLHFDDIALTSWNDIVSNFWDYYWNPTHDGKDPGERLIIKFFTVILPNSRWFLFTVATLLLIPIGVLVYRNSNTLEVPCFFYVFYVSIFFHYLPNSGVRQSLALTLLLIGYLLLQKNKVTWFVVFLILSTFVHKSTLIASLLLPFYYFRRTKSMYYLGALLFIVMLFSYKYVGVFLSMQSDVYQVYGTSEYYAVGQAVPYMVILMILGMYAIGFLGIRKDMNSYNNRLKYGGAALTLVFVILVRLDPNLIRLIAYFGLWMGLMVPYALRLWRPKDYKIYFILIILIFIAKAAISPDDYHFMWQEMELNERYYK